ncbi:MAG: HisA/HisF-related TIM barrel protein [Candidatus Hodgkinia cicadicola]
MKFIPAIDIKDGKCVRLLKGAMSSWKQYALSPLDAINAFGFNKAECIHIVDLDGAIKGFPCNLGSIVEAISCFDGFTQIGGGIRTPEVVEYYLSVGATRVVLGTSAFEDWKFMIDMCYRYPGRICVSIDSVEGFIAIKGWAEVSKLRLEDARDLLNGIPASCVLWTDITRDGTLTGLNFQAIDYVIKTFTMPVVISGGISSIRDIITLKNHFNDSLAGVVCGKAIYERMFPINVANQILTSAND